MFDISEKVAVVKGGGGVLGGSISKHLVKAGLKKAAKITECLSGQIMV
jgi:hypothetical protein